MYLARLLASEKSGVLLFAQERFSVSCLNSRYCAFVGELRVRNWTPSFVPNGHDQNFYLVINNYGKFRPAFAETDRGIHRQPPRSQSAAHIEARVTMSNARAVRYRRLAQAEQDKAKAVLLHKLAADECDQGLLCTAERLSDRPSLTNEQPPKADDAKP